MSKICNKDCFNCPYKDCINDEMDHEDYVEAAERDRNLKMMPEKVASRNKAHNSYYAKNRERILAKRKVYYEANREKITVWKKKYYAENREKVLAQQKVYYEANREKIAARKRMRRGRVCG